MRAKRCSKGNRLARCLGALLPAALKTMGWRYRLAQSSAPSSYADVHASAMRFTGFASPSQPITSSSTVAAGATKAKRATAKAVGRAPTSRLMGWARAATATSCEAPNSRLCRSSPPVELALRRKSCAVSASKLPCSSVSGSVRRSGIRFFAAFANTSPSF